MSKTSIEWTDFTFNPWWGCSKVSAGCANCYAEGVAGRFASGTLWGKGAERKPASKKVWHDPLRWNRVAEKAGRRDLVFCASMADVFEDRRDLDASRERLFDMIRFLTPNLRWLLLSKRPENFHLMPPEVAALVALGVSVENQEAADRRIPLLLSAPAAIRFLSVEPMLGPVDLADWMGGEGGYICCSGAGFCGCHGARESEPPELDWVICGGESGSNARPLDRDWVRSLRNQCQVAGVPFLFKQWGEWAPNWLQEDIDGEELPGTMWMDRMGKRRAGRMLDGREWLEFPEALRQVEA